MKLSSGKNLYAKLIAYLFISAVIFIALATAISLRLEINHARQKAEVMINQLIATIEPTAQVAVYANNRQIAQEVVNGLLQNDVVYKVVISNDVGLKLERSEGEQPEPQQEIVHPLLSPFGDNKVIGQLRVTPDISFSLEEAKYVAFYNAINALVLVGLTLLIMLALVRSFFSRPLQRISRSLNAMITNDSARAVYAKFNENNEFIGIDKMLSQLFTQQIHYQRLKSEESKLRSIFESTSAGLFLLNKNGHIVSCVPTLQKIVGYENIDITNLNFASLLCQDPKVFQQMLQNALESEQLETRDLQLKNTGERALWVHCLLSKIDISDRVYFEGAVFDISKRVATEKAMLYEASYDLLTGLLRRNAAEARLKQQLIAADDSSIIVLLLDLDGFKKANDTYGHDIGDQVLIETAKRLKTCVRRSDIVSRLGGDEFLIILLDNDVTDTGLIVAEKMIASIKAPVTIDDLISVNVGVSIGIALYPQHGSSVEALLKSADQAMYEVKRQGKNGYGIKDDSGIINVKRFY
jgi:diguanylate cyclase (GGDEF)-like protein/PAS domain S-box-containing protein